MNWHLRLQFSIKIFLAVLLFSLLAAACAPTPAGPESFGADDALTEAGLIAALQAAGAEAAAAGTFTAADLTGRPSLLRVNGEDLQIYTYPDPAAAAREAGFVSPDGSQIVMPDPADPAQRTVSMIDWIATPHFYRSGRLIVTYIGDNLEMLTLLETVLGPQFAGGKSEASYPLIVVIVEVAEGAPMSFEEAFHQARDVVQARVVAVKQGPDYFANPEKTICKPAHLVTVAIETVYKGELAPNQIRTIYQWDTGLTDENGRCGGDPRPGLVMMIMDHDPLYELNQRYLLALAPLTAIPPSASEIAGAEFDQVLFNGRLLIEQGGHTTFAQSDVVHTAYDDHGRAIPGRVTGASLAEFEAQLNQWADNGKVGP